MLDLNVLSDACIEFLFVNNDPQRLVVAQLKGTLLEQHFGWPEQISLDTIHSIDEFPDDTRTRQCIAPQKA